MIRIPLAAALWGLCLPACGDKDPDDTASSGQQSDDTGGDDGGNDSPVARIVVGNSQVCAVRPSGSVQCWLLDYFAGGDYDWGQADAPDMDDAFEVTAGTGHSCAVRGEPGAATVECWGFDEYGQVSGAADLPGDLIGADSAHTYNCALDSAGQPHCWGAPFGDTSIPDPPSGASLRMVEVNKLSQVCGISTEDGELVCWQDPELEDWAVGSDIPDGSFLDVSIASFNGAAVEDPGDGSGAGPLTFWGYDQSEYSGERPELATSVELGTYGGCAFAPEGTLHCWSHRDELNFDVPDGYEFVDVSVGTSGVCGVEADGTVLCWGDETSLGGWPLTPSDG